MYESDPERDYQQQVERDLPRNFAIPLVHGLLGQTLGAYLTEQLLLGRTENAAGSSCPLCPSHGVRSGTPSRAGNATPPRVAAAPRRHSGAAGPGPVASAL